MATQSQSKQDNYIITYSSSEYVTLGDWLRDTSSPAFPSNLDKDANFVTITKTDGTNSKEFTINWTLYAETFCSYVDDNQVSNYQKILDRFSYDPILLNQIQTSTFYYNKENLPIKPIIKFAVPQKNVDRATLLTQGLNVITNEAAFKANALAQLERDSRYTPVNYLHSNDKSGSNIKEFYPNMTVWIWCRALSEQKPDASSTDPSTSDISLSGQLFDITKFIYNITTSQGKNGGNFEISLSPLICTRDSKSGFWVIDKNYLLESLTTDPNFKTEYFSETQINKLFSNDQFVRNSFYFHNSISTNDLVFIRFETLELEKETRISDQQKGQQFINKDSLPNRIYDMIGLVDTNRLTINPHSNDIMINISGRDLSKLFIDDGTYFYALENKQGLLNFAGGSTAKNELTKRLVSDNSLIYLQSYFNNSIEKVLQFVIQQLSTIAIVPNDLFSGYAKQTTNTQAINKKLKDILGFSPAEVINGTNDQSITTTFQDSKTAKLQVQLNQKKINDSVIQCKLLIKSFRKTNRIIDTNPDGDYNQDLENVRIDHIYDQLFSFVTTITTADATTGLTFGKLGAGVGTAFSTITGWSKFTNSTFQVNNDNEFPSIFFETEYLLFVNQPAVIVDDTNNIINSIWQITQMKNNLYKELEQQVSPATGIWQLINLVIDKSVSSRRILDPSISSANGSLLNFIHKICQEPFVEFIMDTYADKYYLTVRVPPYNKSNMIRYITGDVYSEDISQTTTNQIVSSTLNANSTLGSHCALVEIDDINVIQENLMFSDDEVYSWYHFTPKGNFFGTDEAYSMAYIPAIFFQEYAEIWGSKPLDLIHNYLPYIPSYSTNRQKNNDILNQAFYDLKYMVETNQYTPFVRKGSITLNQDRRLKIGNPVRYLPTGEIYWIDSVSHSQSINDSSIDAITTIQVSKGMIEQFIYGINGSELNKIFNTTNFKFSESKRFSYFDIINTNLDFTQFRNVENFKTVQVNASTTKVNNLKTGWSTGKISNQLIALVKSTNSLHLSPSVNSIQGQNNGYLNLSYVLGYNCTFNFHNSLIGSTTSSITQKQANDLLIYNLNNIYGKHVKLWNLPNKLLQNQFDAIVLFMFNVQSASYNKELAKIISNFQTGKITQDQLRTAWLNVSVKTYSTTFKSYITNSSFYVKRLAEVTLFIGTTTPPVTQKIQTKRISTGVTHEIDESKVLNNFKVDKEIFNFFLRRQQMDYFNVNKQRNNLSTTNLQNNNSGVNYDGTTSSGNSDFNNLDI